MSKKHSNPAGGASSSKGRQTTLFQTWGYEGILSQGSKLSSQLNTKQSGISNTEIMDDDDDEILCMALDEDISPQEKQFQSINHSKLDLNQSKNDMPIVPKATALETLPGFDIEAGKTWIYPTNMSLRQYQMDIVLSCLYDNTLVCLPTGLGKTFIAAVVVYNYYRWYPQSKIVFMAPTKPLVAQQIEACYNIMGIPQSDTCEMTGNVNINAREIAWNSKRVFFLTPQVMSNDLARGSFPANQVKLIIVDEAHRAQGDYAYCQVVRELMQTGKEFRVVALTATPGTDLHAVRQVIQNLLISHIEIRHEESPDLKEYSHQRIIEKHVIPLDEDMKKVQSMFRDNILEVAITRLGKHGVLGYRGNTTNPDHYSRWALLQARNEFRQNPPSTVDRAQKGMLEGDFSNAISLYHAYELLTKHGLRSFYNFLNKSVGDGSTSANVTRQDSPASTSSPNLYINRRLRYELNRIPVFSEIMNDLRHKFRLDCENSNLNTSRPKMNSQYTQAQNIGVSPSKDQFVVGHPKLAKLRDLIVQHFRTKEDQHIQSRAMIFSETRDSVSEINACLRNYRPLIRPMEFVGQAGKVGKRGLTQKEQVEVLRRFREGNFNTIVSTCVGEEGLDIGEVDLIIFYDVSKSPIRLIQRMGRTGRKREGRIVVLLTEGKQEQIYNAAIYSKNSIKKALLDKNKLAQYLSKAPRMVPRGNNPICHKMELRPQIPFVGKKRGTKQKKLTGNEKIKPISSPNILETITMKHTKCDAYPKTNGFLSTSELDYWTKHFKLPYKDNLAVPKITSREETWLKSQREILENIKEQEKNVKPNDSKNNLDLSEWILWQDIHQKRHCVSQSRTSKILEDILNTNRNSDEISNNEMNFVSASSNQYKETLADSNAKQTKTTNIFVVSNINNEECVLDEMNQTHRKQVTGMELNNVEFNDPQRKDYIPMKDSESILPTIGTPTHVLDIAENGLDSGEEEDFKFWQSWFPINEEVSKLKIKPPPNIDAMLKSIPKPHIIRAFDIDAAWKKNEKEFHNDSEIYINLAGNNDNKRPSNILNQTTNNFIPQSQEKNCSTNQQPICTNKRNIADEETLITSTPSRNLAKRSKLANISPIAPNSGRSFSARKVNKFRVIPEDEDDNAHTSSNDQPKSVFSATQLVSFINQTSFYLSNDKSNIVQSRKNVTKENLTLHKSSASTNQNAINLTTEEIKLVQKMSFQDTHLISESLKEAFDVSYDDVVVRSTPVIQSKRIDCLEKSKSSDFKEHTYNSCSVLLGSWGMVNNSCDIIHRTIDDVLKCSSYDNKQIQTEYYSNFDIILDERSLQLSEQYAFKDVDNDKNGPEFKIPDLEAFETKSKTPSRPNKQSKSNIKSPEEVSHFAKFTYEESSHAYSYGNKRECKMYKEYSVPKHFDPEVFSQLPSDVQKELLVTQKHAAQREQWESPDKKLEESQIIGCTKKGKNRKILFSSSDDDQVSETDSPFPRWRPKVQGKIYSSTHMEDNNDAPEAKGTNQKQFHKPKYFDARKFINMEAVLSDSEGEGMIDSESDGVEIDGYDASFVDDATQKPMDDVDEQAHYLKSIKAPMQPPIWHRSPRKSMKREDIFSQFDDIEDEYDMHDSFVVDSDVIEYDSNTDPLDFVDEFQEGKIIRKTEILECKKAKVKKRGRILTKAQSSSSDEEQNGKIIGKPDKILKSPHIEKESSNDEKCAPLLPNKAVRPVTCVNITNDLLEKPDDEKVTFEKIIDNISKTGQNANTLMSKDFDISRTSTLVHSNSTTTSIETETNNSSILISASEVQRAQDIVSALRHKHRMNVVTSKPGIDVGASYMLSPRCAVLRITTQEFCNATYRTNLTAKCQKMNELFERPWIIVENEKKYGDRMNPDDVVVTSTHQLFGKGERTKYIDGVLAQLSQSNIKVLFSESQIETAEFLAAVLKKEANKGFTLPRHLKLDKRAETLIPFYLSIPGISLGTALHLLVNYPTPKDFIRSAQTTMLRKSNLTDATIIKKIQSFLKKELVNNSLIS